MESHVAILAAWVSGFVVFCSLTWRLIAPRRMRSVIRAVRQAPERVVRILHVTKQAWIVIRTADHRLVIKATNDGPALFELLRRRCPTAQFKIR
jgi:hypothetical protein